MDKKLICKEIIDFYLKINVRLIELTFDEPKTNRVLLNKLVAQNNQIIKILKKA